MTTTATIPTGPLPWLTPEQKEAFVTHQTFKRKAATLGVDFWRDRAIFWESATRHAFDKWEGDIYRNGHTLIVDVLTLLPHVENEGEERDVDNAKQRVLAALPGLLRLVDTMRTVDLAGHEYGHLIDRDLLEKIRGVAL